MVTQLAGLLALPLNSNVSYILCDVSNTHCGGHCYTRYDTNVL